MPTPTDSAPLPQTRERTITIRLFVRVAVLLSVIGLFVVFQLVLVPLFKPAPSAVAAVPQQASAVQASERPAESSMLRASGYAVIKDKLD